MTVKSYLDYISSAAYVRDTERQSINNSIHTLQMRLKGHFDNNIKSQFIFGSYSRGTILPRNMDRNSDIDYMVIFRDSSLQPQSYLNKLRYFVESSYSRSEIRQSHPTIKLSLNHISFELVPAICHQHNLFIPAKTSDKVDWLYTNPADLNTKLSYKNQLHRNLIKPLVRLVKYWNVLNGKVFESYELEQKIIDFQFSKLSVFQSFNLETYFYEFMSELNVPQSFPDWKKQKIQEMKQLISSIKWHSMNVPVWAELTLKVLLPAPNFKSFKLERRLNGNR